MVQPSITADRISAWKSAHSPFFPHEGGLPYPISFATPGGAVSALGIRDALAQRVSPLPTRPCDAFVMACGDAGQSHWTRFGGIPHRPDGQRWPRSRSGSPLTFVIQFCLADSRDIVGETPGDVLLVFMDGDYLDCSNPDSLQFEWQPLDIPNLSGVNPYPEAVWQQFTGFGMRIRTLDFEDVDKVAEFVTPLAIASQNMRYLDIYYDVLAKQFARIPGPKIGGLPLWYWESSASMLAHGDRFIASFGGFAAGWDSSWPWANRERPLSTEERLSTRNHVDFYDGFVVNIFLGRDGCVKWRADFP